MILVGFAAFILVVILVSLTKFISKTIPSDEIRNYCVDNTDIGATSFIRYEISSDPSYAFWVAQDSTSNSQEIFIFRKAARFGFIEIKNRFSYVYHASSSIDMEVGSVMFMPRDDKNKKKSTNLLVFYSSNQKRITYYTLLFQEDGEECTRKGKVSMEQAFIVSISGLGVNNGVMRKFMKAEFYDDNWNLVTTIEY